MSLKGKSASVGIILAIMIAVCSLAAVGHEPTVNEISALTVQVIKANPKFTDPNVVHEGDTVRVPLEVGYKTYEVKDWMLHKEQGCLWYISQMHLRGDGSSPVPGLTGPGPRPASGETVTTASGDTAKSWPTPPPPPPIQAETSGGSNIPWWAWLLIASVLILVAWAVYSLLPRFSTATHPNGPPDDVDSLRGDPANPGLPNNNTINDPQRFPPVVAGGLAPDLVQATQQLLDTNHDLIGTEPAMLVQRGRLIRESGVLTLEVEMRFGNLSQHINLIPPVNVTRLVLQNGREIYVRTECGNRFGMPGDTFRAQFPLPNGWVFVADASYAPPPINVSTTTTPAQPNATALAQDNGERTITITMKDGNKEVTLTAKGSADHMPTKVEQSDGKFVVLFPRGDNPQR